MMALHISQRASLILWQIDVYGPATNWRTTNCLSDQHSSLSASPLHPDIDQRYFADAGVGDNVRSVGSVENISISLFSWSNTYDSCFLLFHLLRSQSHRTKRIFHQTQLLWITLKKMLFGLWSQQSHQKSAWNTNIPWYQTQDKFQHLQACCCHTKQVLYSSSVGSYCIVRFGMFSLRDLGLQET